MAVTDTTALLYPAVQETIATLGLLGEDSAAVRLAQRYAVAIDGAAHDGNRSYTSALRWLGPELLKVLAELGATPAARAAITKGTPIKPATGKSQLDLLREARAGRGA